MSPAGNADSPCMRAYETILAIAIKYIKKETVFGRSVYNRR